MLSGSALVKLKAFLIIDLVIVCAAVGAYVYLQNQGVIIGPVKSASFVFSDLVVSPAETFVSQPVQISVNVTNVGNVAGEVFIDLELNGVVCESVSIVLEGLNSHETVEFTVVETVIGEYNVKVGGLISTFLLKAAPPNTSKIALSVLKTSPVECCVGDTVSISATAKNPSTNNDMLLVSLTVDGVLVGSTVVELAAGATSIVEFTYTVLKEGTHNVKLNSLTGSFVVVPEGYHTLILARSGGSGLPLPYTINGKSIETHRYTEILPAGDYTISVPQTFDVGTGVVGFTGWSDGVASSTRSVTLDKRTILVANYVVLSGYASCPSLYIWNGTGYSYVTDVSNSGWLGYIGYITANGEIVFNGGNPYDYVKLDNKVLTAKDGYFDITLSQQWDELFYLDSANLLVVDHPKGTDVYTTMSNILNKGYTGQIYTTATTDVFLAPITAINEKGENVLTAILYQDNIFTPGINGNDSPAWNNIVQNQLTLNLGDLSEADSIKLVITGMVDWGPFETYYEWINKFIEAGTAGLIEDNTSITPVPKMEFLSPDGNWVEVSQNRQIPMPSDYTARTFIVDLTDLFPKDTTEYVVRFTNFWNVTYDYIGIDITNQQDITITNLKPSTATLGQFWDETTSTSTGAFTRYGDVTPLIQETDDMFIIGRQCDQVNMQFYITDLPEIAKNMERSYFLVVACWFKDPPDAWGYGFTFTVDPLPFLNMTGFPYPNNETYPYDTIHLTYLQEYNTRIIT
ncbi:MAG: hypothetical protein LBE76_03120 [Nitrososphaerota archaeon]|nr:hypothetical protein [Nitrososphaerota archaeon]